MASKIRKVICAMSGGVDSSVAAYLLKKKGFNVHGVFMKNWDVTNEKGMCSSDIDKEDARFVCHHLDIPFTEVNFVKEYWNDVFSQMVEGYEKGTTPNPDVLCNKHVKFGPLFNYATCVLGGDALATGHYARNSFGQYLQHCEPEKGSKLLSAIDPVKDQTLFLAQVPQKSLQRTMFPLGGYMKKQVKEIAKEAGLTKIAQKKESMGICFIGSRNFHNFIEEYIPPKQGRFVCIETGKIMGTHKGTHYWTVGQRTLLSGLTKAMFVQRVDCETQDIWVAPGTNHPSLFSLSLVTGQPHWIHEPPRSLYNTGQMSCQFRFQHIHPLTDCTLTLTEDGGLHATLDRPLRALTPGQYAVFYDNLECLGSALILEPGPSLMDSQGDNTPVQNITAYT